MLKSVSSITNAIGALNFKGTWNAATNTPTIVSGVGVKGDYFVVSVAGSTTIDGISNWGIGDWIVYNGNIWQRVEGGADLNGVNLTVTNTTTLSGLTASTALALDATKNVVSVANTGTGDNVLATSPTLVTPVLGSASATSVTVGAGTALLPSITTAGDVNTGIFFSAADTVDISTGGVARAQINSAGDFAIDAGFGSVGKAYLCRAWVNFNGTTNVGGNCTIRTSGNVSTVADNGTGNYTVNFTTAMPDADFAMSLSAGDSGASNQCFITRNGSSTTSVTVRTFNGVPLSVDFDPVYIAIFR